MMMSLMSCSFQERQQNQIQEGERSSNMGMG